MTVREKLARTRDWVAQWAVRLVPYRVRYWTFIEMTAKATLDSPNIPATPLDELMGNIELPRGVR